MVLFSLPTPSSPKASRGRRWDRSRAEPRRPVRNCGKSAYMVPGHLPDGEDLQVTANTQMYKYSKCHNHCTVKPFYITWWLTQTSAGRRVLGLALDLKGNSCSLQPHQTSRVTDPLPPLVHAPDFPCLFYEYRNASVL